MGWQHGYFADEGYSYGVHPHQAPARIALAALLQGHNAPDLSGPFHYLDLGCGQGLMTCLLAAAHPQARFTGVDFHPEHIAHAQRLATSCGLTNVTFLEADFLELAEHPPEDWPPADFAVAHGIASWIAPPVRTALLRLASRALRPGGLFYVSYNTFPGWLSMVPFQHLVASFQQRLQPGRPSLEAARALFGRLEEAQASLMRLHPQLPKRLAELAKQDPAYLVQEYNNGFWQPLFVDQMIGEAAEAKLTFVGTATLVEAIEANYSEAQRKLLAEAGDPAMRELCRDLLITQNFRRDVYAKGADRLWPAQRLPRLEQLQVVALAGPDVLERDDLFTFATSLGTVNGKPEVYRPLLEAIQAGSVSLAELRRQLSRLQPSGEPLKLNILLQGLAFLLEKHLVALVPDAGVDQAPAQRCNAALVAAISDGAPYTALATPLGGNSLSIQLNWALALDGLRLGLPVEQLTGHVLKKLSGLGRMVKGEDGQPLPPAAAAAKLQSTTVDPLLRHGLPLLRQLGCWPTQG